MLFSAQLLFHAVRRIVHGILHLRKIFWCVSGSKVQVTTCCQQGTSAAVTRFRRPMEMNTSPQATENEQETQVFAV